MKILIGRKERKSNTTRYAIRGGNENLCTVYCRPLSKILFFIYFFKFRVLNKFRFNSNLDFSF